MTLVVASLVERSIAGVARSSRKAFEAGADLVEVRLDHLRGIDDRVVLVEDAREAVDGPAIATLRSHKEGGLSQLEGSARRRLLDRIADAGFEYIDLESARDGALLRKLKQASRGHPKTISSYHFKAPASRARVKERVLSAQGTADISKVAMPCENAAQAVMLAEVALGLPKKRKASAVMGMGAQGQLTRVCADGIGSELVYACLPGKEAAPGQLHIAAQKSLLRDDSFVLGLIGHPVAHSVSKPMQEAALRSLGLNGIYLPLDIPPAHMTREAVDTLFDIGFDGLNVTVPNKRRAHHMCDSVEPAAKATGAVNTLLRRRGRLVGENTDVAGFAALLSSEKVALENATALVIGAGGAARAVCKVLADGGADIAIAARRPRPALELSKAFDGRGVRYSTLGRSSEAYDIVVNATPIGTRGSEQERIGLPAGAIRNARTFVDLVYNPPETPNMDIARREGRRTVGGLEMLVRQGEEAFRLWTGRSPDLAAMRRAARKAVGA